MSNLNFTRHKTNILSRLLLPQVDYHCAGSVLSRTCFLDLDCGYIRGIRPRTKSVRYKLLCYKSRMAELSVFNGCILWGSRIVVPPPGRNYVLEELHTAHPGISHMKSLARGHMWWPKMDKDLEVKVHMCQQCQTNKKLTRCPFASLVFSCEAMVKTSPGFCWPLSKNNVSYTDQCIFKMAGGDTSGVHHNSGYNRNT